ncbi:MAG: SRPBCC domain-containing protein [Luteolibacter sp.]
MDATQYHCSRIVNFPRSKVFAAHRDPSQLAIWWGPAGFTNTFHEFDFREGGRWHFTMHGPDGANYDNLWIFQHIIADELIDMRHDCAPFFNMRITLTDVPEGTCVDWLATFDEANVLAAILPIIKRCNEENFDRLEAALSKIESCGN